MGSEVFSLYKHLKCIQFSEVNGEGGGGRGNVQFIGFVGARLVSLRKL